MSREVTFLFDTVDEREAFKNAVRWVNDSSIEELRNTDDAFGVVYKDTDGTADATIDYRKEGRA